MEHGTHVWSTRAWQDAVVGWADEALAVHRTIRTGGPQRLRVRPWSTTMVLPTDRGRVWIKAVAPFAAHGPALAESLAEVLPGRARAPLAVDVDRGWTLTRDEGEPLAHGPADLAVWCDAVRDVATLCRAAHEHEARLLRTGLPDLRPAHLTVVADDLVATLGALPDDHPDHLDPATADDVRAALPGLAATARALAAGPVPATLRHGDLHLHNVVGERPHRVLDLDDSHWAHPFEDLVAPRRIVGDALGAEAADAVVDAYLSAWDDVAPRAELRRLADLAARAQPVPRAFTWRSATASLPRDELGRWGGNVRAWLERLTAPPPRERS